MHVHYEISVPHDVDRACIEQLKVVQKKNEFFDTHPTILQRFEICTKGGLEVANGAEGCAAKPGLERWKRRKSLNFHAHGRWT